jgi:WD40 repeat protein
MEVSKDGSVLVTGSDDKTVRLWSAKSEAVECIGLLEGHENYITSVLIEDNYVLSSSADMTIRKWNMSTCECQLVFMGHESTVNKMLCTGDFIFSVSYDKKARCWDFDTGECVRIFTGHKNNVTSILFIRGERISKKKTNKFGSIIQNSNESSKSDFYQTENEEVQDLIITGSLDSLAKSWSVHSGDCVHTFRGHQAGITSLVTDEPKKTLFTGSADHNIISWDIHSAQILKTFSGHQNIVIHLFVNSLFLVSHSYIIDHSYTCLKTFSVIPKTLVLDQF